METHAQLLREREVLIQRIAELGPLRMGSVCEQYLPTRRRDGSLDRRGPYLTYTFKHEGRTRGRHLRDEHEARLYRRQIENWQRYRELSAQLVQVGQRLADLEVQAATAGAGAKKNSRRPSKPSSRPKRRG